MGGSVRPEQDPFADLVPRLTLPARPAGQGADPFGDLLPHLSVPSGATDSTMRMTPLGPDGRPAVVMAEPPGAFARTRAALAQQADSIRAHPVHALAQLGKTIVTAPVESFQKAVLAPSTDEVARTARGDVSPAAEGFAGKMGIALRTPDAAQRALLETPGVTEGERALAAGQTLANVAAGPLGKGVASVAGRVFPRALASLAGAGASGAAIGAAYDPQDPLVGAGVGATVGGGLHVAIPAATAAVAAPFRALGRAADVSAGMTEAGAAGVKEAMAQEAPRFTRSREPNPDPLAAENVAAARAQRIATGQEPAATKLPDGKVLELAPAQAKRLTKAMAAQQAREAAKSGVIVPGDYLGGGRAVDKMAPKLQTPEQAAARPAIGLVGPDGTPIADLPKREQPKAATRFDAAGRPTAEPAPKAKGPRFSKTIPDAAPASEPDLPIEHAPLKAKVLELTKQLGRVAQERDEARRTAETDALTGLANRGAYDHALPSAEKDPATSVVRFDLNGFKSVNDAVSHQAGDEVLRSMRGVMEQAAKETGIPARAFRVGGDEFAALVPAAQAEAFRARVEELYGVQEHAPGVKSSVSGGIGATDAAADAEAIQRKQAQKAAQGIAGRGAPVALPGEAPAAGDPVPPKPSLADRLKAAEEKAAPAVEEPVEEIDVDAREAERLKAERKAERDEAGPKEKKLDYRTASVDQLLDELHGEYGRLEQEGNRIKGGWARQTNEGGVVSGGTFAEGRARQQFEFAKRRMTALEKELAKRGVDETQLSEEMQTRRERDLIQAGDAEGGDTSFDFGDAEREPAGVAAKEAATTRPREYVNYFRKGLDQSTEARVRDAIERGRETGAIDKGRKTFVEQQAEADEYAKKLVADPLMIDREKLSKLSGAQVQGAWQVVQQNGRLMEAASRILNDASADAGAVADAQRVFDGAMKSTDELLATVVRETAQTARDLGFHRQIAKHTLDPEVWLVQAKRLLGDRPLTEEMMTTVRRLANEAKTSCGGA
jgi:diguanylate cyclase (GGDEF)-like protein